MNIGRLEWSDQLRIGIDQLDDGHKELIDLYNRNCLVVRKRANPGGPA